MKNDRSPVTFLTVSADEVERRIDNFLHSYFKVVPKSRIYRMLRQGEVRVNKKRIKPEYKVQENDLVRLPPLWANFHNHPMYSQSINSKKVVNLTSTILFEDEYLMVLNKPSGVAVHGGNGIHFGIIESLRILRPELRFLELVHRIDRDTSGVLLVAKKRAALRSLHQQLRDKSVQKIYLALVRGSWSEECSSIQAPLHKYVLPGGNRVVRVNINGKKSETKFKVCEYFRNSTLVEAVPITGRTHQIRVHTQYAGHPIAFDSRYGDKVFDAQLKMSGLNRLFLHAMALRFIHPCSKTKLEIKAPFDQLLIHCMTVLRQEKLSHLPYKNVGCK